jgi:hypothetical protein
MEIRSEFRSKMEWDEWQEANQRHFPQWQHAILASVRQDGILEPVTDRRVDPNDIKIVDGGLRESLSFDGTNSRKRALLLQLDVLRGATPRLAARTARIFAAEALSRTALILRGRYPYFIGTEFIPDPKKRLSYYPIPHADLLALDMPDGVFDLVMTGDVLEHVPNLPQAIAEMARVLRPGGILISTFQFEASRTETQKRAELVDGRVVHTMPPEYHGDPLDPTGVLVFQEPSWDVLDVCKQTGLGDAKMTLHASATYGIVGDDVPGIFVLCASKVDQKTVRPARQWIWGAARINSVVGVLGLPRSGTTMFTAVLDAHDEVVAVYEPWNAHKADAAAQRAVTSVSALLKDAEARKPKARTLVIKETTLDPTYPERLSDVLSSAIPPLSRHLLILLRNPFHCFLSEVEGRRRWWGEASLEVSQNTFAQWTTRSVNSYRQLLDISARHPSTFVFYEEAVERPLTVFQNVMDQVGAQFQPNQLLITRNADLSRIRGDMSLVENARDVMDGSVTKRQMEFDLVRQQLEVAPGFHRLLELERVFCAYRGHGALAATAPLRKGFIDAVTSILGEDC